MSAGEQWLTGCRRPNRRYTARENDNIGLQYSRARFYSPTFHRFISEDPIGFLGGDTNLYAYAHNKPTGFRDPLGLYIAEYTSPPGGSSSLDCPDPSPPGNAGCGGIGVGGGHDGGAALPGGSETSPGSSSIAFVGGTDLNCFDRGMAFAPKMRPSIPFLRSCCAHFREG